MTNEQNLIDRVRIERAVWTLDALIGDLPHRSRVDKRRELRFNLRAAAGDVGTAEAIRRLGPLRSLAAEFLVAEFGEGRSHGRWGSSVRWAQAVLWAFLVELTLTGFTSVGNSAFIAGVVGADPHATGTYVWDGPRVLGLGGDFTFVDGVNTAIGGYFAAPFQLWVLLALVLGGRVWRLLPGWRRA